MPICPALTGLRGGRVQRSSRLDIHNLGGVIEARDGRRRVREAAADHQPAIVDAGGQLREKALTWGEDALLSNAPLAAVGMAAEDQVDIPAAQVFRVILRVMREQNLIPREAFETVQSGGLRFGDQVGDLPPDGIELGPVLAVQAVIQCVVRGEPADPHAAAPGPGVVQQGDTGFADQRNIRLPEGQLVIANGKKSGRDAGTEAQEGEHVLLREDKRGIPPGEAAEKHIAGKADELGPAGGERAADSAEGVVVQVCQQGNRQRNRKAVNSLNDGGQPPFNFFTRGLANIRRGWYSLSRNNA